MRHYGLAARFCVAAVLAFVGIPAAAQEYTGQWGLAAIGVTPELHAQYTGAGYAIAVVDGRTIEVQPDLTSHLTRIAPFGGTYADITEHMREHGTHVSSIAAGSANGQGVVGAAPGAWIYNYAGFDDNYAFVKSTANERVILNDIAARNALGAKIAAVNMSYGQTAAGDGYIFFAGELAMFSEFKDTAVLVRAAHNQGAQIPTYKYVGDPRVGLGHLLIVGSVDKDLRLSSFSNYPGESCFRADPSVACGPTNKIKYHFVVAPGRSILGAVNPSTYEYWSGTSMATPFVTGIAALVKQANPALSPSQIAEAIKTSAIDLGAPGVDGIYGWGLVSAPRAIAAATTPTAVIATAAGASVGVVKKLPATKKKVDFFYGMNVGSAPQFNFQGERSFTYTTVGVAAPLGPFQFNLTRSGRTTAASLRLEF